MEDDKNYILMSPKTYVESGDCIYKFKHEDGTEIVLEKTFDVWVPHGVGYVLVEGEYVGVYKIDENGGYLH